MATFTISGNVIAVNARLRLLSVNYMLQGADVAITYSDASGNYTFSGIAPGIYQIKADLAETTTPPYNSGYSFRTPQVVSVIANNLTGVNFTPVLLNAVNPPNNAA
jgi:hypothetical protein